jgi:hypothetical protein
MTSIDNFLNRISPQRQELFAQECIKRLTSKDFNANLELSFPDVTIVLFYVEGILSQRLLRIFSLTAQQVAGPLFAACNLMVNKINITRLIQTDNHKSGCDKSLIVLYQNGRPKNIYDGELSVYALSNYSLTLD